MSDLREAARLALIALENGTSPNLWLSTKENLRKALAQPDEVSAEREACAKICDKEQEFVASGGPYVFSASRCATNIRARGDK